MSKEIHLPVIQPVEAEPEAIKEPYVSFSEVSLWLECSFRHKLKYIDKIRMDQPSEHTEFGTIIHEILEEFLKTRVLPTDYSHFKEKLREAFEKLPPNPERKLPEEEWQETIEPIMKEIPQFMETNFPGWEFVDAEYELFEPIPDEEKKFKGYIDAVIRVPNGDGTFIYHLLDWKGSGTGWNSYKKKDQNKLLQLVLYKTFFSKKMEIDPKNIRCGFVILKRLIKKQKCELFSVPVEEKDMEEGIEKVERMLASVRMGLFPKNRNSCRFCPYANTKHCI